MSQLLPDGAGFGTFHVNTTAPSTQRERPEQITTDALKTIDPGVILRFIVVSSSSSVIAHSAIVDIPDGG